MAERLKDKIIEYAIKHFGVTDGNTYFQVKKISETEHACFTSSPEGEIRGALAFSWDGQTLKYKGIC